MTKRMVSHTGGPKIVTLQGRRDDFFVVEKKALFFSPNFTIEKLSILNSMNNFRLFLHATHTFLSCGCERCLKRKEITENL